MIRHVWESQREEKRRETRNGHRICSTLQSTPEEMVWGAAWNTPELIAKRKREGQWEQASEKQDQKAEAGVEKEGAAQQQKPEEEEEWPNDISNYMPFTRHVDQKGNRLIRLPYKAAACHHPVWRYDKDTSTITALPAQNIHLGMVR